MKHTTKQLFAFLLIIGLAFLFTQCKGSKKATAKNQSETVGQALVVDKAFDPKAAASDSFKADSVWIVGNNLHLRLKYSGGCEDHDFQLHWNEFYMKSLPPKTNLFLVHNANNDHCRELVNQELVFDITPVQYTGQQQVNLMINNYPLEIEYHYTGKKK